MDTLTPGSILGHAVRRVEDGRLITGSGRYVDDIKVENGLHAAFVRSTVAHADIRSIDTGAAVATPGVIAVLTDADLGLQPKKGFETVPAHLARPRLARGRVRFVGEPVAIVVAESRQAAVDGAQLVGVELDPLEAVVDPAEARDGRPVVLFSDHGSNVAAVIGPTGDPGGLAGAEVRVRGSFVNQRLAPVPMEPDAILAVPEAGGLHVWATNQTPFGLRADIAASLGLEVENVRVAVPDMGGGFGAKAGARPEMVVVAAVAMRLGRPVRWIETRTENLMCMTHGRAQVQEIEVGASRDGRLAGMRVNVIADLGAYPTIAILLPGLTGLMSAGVYDVPGIEFRADCVVTNTTPLGAYRGAGRPEAATMVERAMDMLAVELGMDPAELRRRNFIKPDRFPIKTAGGATYDSGDYERALDRLLEISNYGGLREEQRARRERGDRLQLGVGLSVYVEVTAVGTGPEFGAVRIESDGTAVVQCGTTSFGQGHETSLAQIAAEPLGLPLESVRVEHSDTGVIARGSGTVGSRSMQFGGSAVHRAAIAVRDKSRDLAAHLLEADPRDISFVAGAVGVAGVPERAFSWSELAAAAADPGRLPAGMEPGLAADSDFRGDGSYPFGAHCAVVEVDMETGAARVDRFFAVDDCGRIINPLLAEGQVHGGIAQGLAQALYEEVVFDASGNPLTATLIDYTVPTIAETPELVTASTVTPSPNNPLGAKGIGESGTIGSTPAVQNAVVDALAHLGVRHIDMPLTPERVWRAIGAAAGR